MGAAPSGHQPSGHAPVAFRALRPQGALFPAGKVPYAALPATFAIIPANAINWLSARQEIDATRGNIHVQGGPFTNLWDRPNRKKDDEHGGGLRSQDAGTRIR